MNKRTLHSDINEIIDEYLNINKVSIEILKPLVSTAKTMIPIAILSKVGYEILIKKVSNDYSKVLGVFADIHLFLELGGIDLKEIRKSISITSKTYEIEHSMPDLVKEYNTIEDIEDWQIILYLIILIETS